MACGLYGKPLAFTPTLTPAAEIFGVFPNGPQITMKLKVKEIGPVNKQQTQYGNRQHCIYTLVGQDENISIRADCWQDHIQTCLAALPIGTMFSISFCPKPLPQQLIAPIIPWGIRLNTECQISDIPVDGGRVIRSYGHQEAQAGFYTTNPPQGDRYYGNPGVQTHDQYPGQSLPPLVRSSFIQPPAENADQQPEQTGAPHSTGTGSADTPQ